ncbi:outer membrane protein assembly factor BamB family protein [Deinococcus sp. PESE-13]
MRRYLLLLSLALTACTSQNAPTPGEDALAQLPALTLQWSFPDHKVTGYTTLLGNLLLGGRQVTAIDTRTHQLAFKLPLDTDNLRTNYAALGDHLIALTGRNADTLTVLDRSGQTLNTVAVPGGTRQSFKQLGPFVAGASLYVVSGARLYRYRTADLLRPDAQPVWVRKYPGFGLASLIVKDEDHLFVSTNAADVSHELIALNSQGETRWSLEVAPATIQGSAALILGLYKNLIIAQAGVAGLQAYDADTGEKAWKKFPDINVCPGGQANTAFRMSVADDRVFIGPWGGTCILAYHAATGELAWVFDAPNHVTFDTTPLDVNGVVYASNSRLWALDAETGKALAVGRENLSDNLGAPLSYDPAGRQVLHWGAAGVHAYQPLR